MRIGIIGVGKLGEFHTKLLAEIANEQPAVECAGVFDLNTARAEEMAAKYAVPASPPLPILPKGVTRQS